jgi:hypothetical protein
MLRKMIVVTAAAAVLSAAALAPADASATYRKWRGARGGFHGADVYYPEFYTPLFAPGSMYCWHWFRVGRGWARAWAC